MGEIMHISEDFIIYFENNLPYLIDVKNKEEFCIHDKSYFEAILKYLQNGSLDAKIRSEFLENNLIVKQKIKSISKYNNKVADLFHQASNNILKSFSDMDRLEFAENYLMASISLKENPLPNQNYSVEYSEDELVHLPEPTKEKYNKQSLFEVLDRRKTIREFYSHTVETQQLSDLLFTCFGYFHRHKDNETEEYGVFKRRTSPSGGCLQSIDAYLVIFDVADIAPGIYRYDAENHILCKERDGITYDELKDLLIGQFFGDNSSFGIFLAGNLEVFTWKYKTLRNYRVSFMEAGHFSQTLQLCVIAENLNCWISGAFNDTKIEEYLNIRNKRVIPMFYVAIGKGKYKRMNRIMTEKRNELNLV